MKICSSYRQLPSHSDLLDQIRFSRLGDLLDYNHKNPGSDKILILEIDDMSQRQFNGQPTTPSLYADFMLKIATMQLDFYSLNDLNIFVTYLMDTNTELYHRYMYHYPAETYNMLNALIDYEVGYITIDEPLVFDIDNVYRYMHTHDENCKLRIRPDRGQPVYMPKQDFSSVCHFWVLPQHIHFYEQYVDVIDLLAIDDKRESRLILVYGKDKKWEIDMTPLIYNLHLPIALKGVFMDDEVAEKRLNCKQICQSTVPQRCHRCELEAKIYDQLSRGKRPILEDNTTQSQS